jgi:hypothetical protein
MIEREYPFDTYTITCDFCGVELSVDGDFQDALKELKLNGWVSLKEGYTWKHKCLDCLKKKGEL